VLVADIAHIAGLIVGGVHESPVPHAPVISTTTHKTLRGPRGAILMTREDLATPIDRAVFPGLQGGPHDHTTAAIAVALHEAAQPGFREYAQAIVDNASRLADALIDRGFELVSGGTDNHLILINLENRGVTGRPAAEGLARAGLVCNRNTIPFETRKPMDPSGLRIGTPALTTRGIPSSEMETIAAWLDEGLRAVAGEDEHALYRIRREVELLAAEYPPPY
jgi:glycine hydroxymethyltransferase